ncbi:unnamed protein product [Polarella glacialis]|uniref:EF-hand domain-containing protein n=1 Tax=Polarella glacialis TaxID=89957 RepID=A0A813IEM5_POLGL|nr:unnamed protein product [Polarella glacialis]
MLDQDGGGSISPDEFKNALSRWLHDSKTATRFVKYNVMQMSTEQGMIRGQVHDLTQKFDKLLLHLAEHDLGLNSSKRITKLQRSSTRTLKRSDTKTSVKSETADYCHQRGSTDSPVRVDSDAESTGTYDWNRNEGSDTDSPCSQPLSEAPVRTQSQEEVFRVAIDSPGKAERSVAKAIEASGQALQDSAIEAAVRVLKQSIKRMGDQQHLLEVDEQTNNNDNNNSSATHSGPPALPASRSCVMLSSDPEPPGRTTFTSQPMLPLLPESESDAASQAALEFSI